MNLEKLKQWIHRKAEEEMQPEINELIWIKKKVRIGEKIDWTFVDTVDYNIDSIPKRRELIFEFKGKPKEIKKEWQKMITCQN